MPHKTHHGKQGQRLQWSKRKSYGVTEFETFTLAEGESHSWFVSPLIKAELSVRMSASYIINSCRYAAGSGSSSLTIAEEKSRQSLLLGKKTKLLTTF